MNLQPSKLSLAANQVWNESTSLFSKKKDIQIDLGLEKGLGKSNPSSQEKTSSSIASGYVFGSRVAERVTKSGSSCPITSNQENLSDVSSIFKRICEKTGDSKNDLWKSSCPANNSTEKTNGSDTSSSSTSDRLKASIDEMAKKNQIGSELNSVEPIATGEEDEWPLLNISCKFFHYNTETKNWIERGMGTFRIKKKKGGYRGTQHDIRILGRTTGNQKVIINSKIFPGMIRENISEKRVKISAQNPDSELPQLFIIQGSITAIYELETMLQKFIDEVDAHHIETTQLSYSSYQMSRKRKPADSAKEDAENKKFAAESRNLGAGPGDSDDDENEEEEEEAAQKRMISEYPKKNREGETTKSPDDEESHQAKNDDW